jgi:hypothetical protein
MAVQRYDEWIGRREAEAVGGGLEALGGVPGERLVRDPQLGDQQARRRGAPDRVDAAGRIQVGRRVEAELAGEPVVEVGVLERAVALPRARSHATPPARMLSPHLR